MKRPTAAQAVPGFWQFETTGVLRPAIEAYLFTRGPLTDKQVAAIRAYLRQWINGPWKAAPGAEERVLERLRSMVDGLVDRSAINVWIMQATDLGLDPL
jgi:hypothetical protein